MKPLEEIEARLRAAMPLLELRITGRPAIAEFIAHAPTDIARLIKALRECIDQRNYWAEYAGEYLKEKHLHRDNAELQKILEGE